MTRRVEKVPWHGWTQQPVRQKSSKNGCVYEFLLRADFLMRHMRYWVWIPLLKVTTAMSNGTGEINRIAGIYEAVCHPKER